MVEQLPDGDRGAVRHDARQPALQPVVEDPSVVRRYTERRQTLYDHNFTAGGPSVGALRPLRGPDGPEPVEDGEAEGF
ncbi:hypothetical protein ACFV0O_30580 [Kitasatospora sp. NPDC059577]|uniref:hypothetical protein n=1 Tax=Kitasatospora sp. NPDC059577 TaxID=3346873 RepID=UPI0036834246